MSFKARFKDKIALEAELTATWGTFTEEVQTKLAHLQTEYALILKRKKVGATLIVVAVAPLFALDALSDVAAISKASWWVTALIVYFCVVLPVCMYYAAKSFRDPNNVVARYTEIMQTIVFAKVFTLFGLVGERVVRTPYAEPVSQVKLSLWQRLKLNKEKAAYQPPESLQAINLLTQSELVTEPHNVTNVDDLLRVSFGVNELFLAELDLKHVTGSGKNRHTKYIFKGYFVAFDLPTKLEAKTFISTEGDTVGFANRTVINNLVSNTVRETQLEWNAFETLLHVATTSEVEARYILTTNFMQDLYDWWVGKKQNIRISFIGSRMYLLFPDSSIRVFGGVRSLDTEDLRTYIISIAEPLMHVLHLVEDVRIRS